MMGSKGSDKKDKKSKKGRIRSGETGAFIRSVRNQLEGDDDSDWDVEGELRAGLELPVDGDTPIDDSDIIQDNDPAYAEARALQQVMHGKRSAKDLDDVGGHVGADHDADDLIEDDDVEEVEEVDTDEILEEEDDTLTGMRIQETDADLEPTAVSDVSSAAEYQELDVDNPEPGRRDTIRGPAARMVPQPEPDSLVDMLEDVRTTGEEEDGESSFVGPAPEGSTIETEVSRDHQTGETFRKGEEVTIPFKLKELYEQVYLTGPGLVKFFEDRDLLVTGVGPDAIVDMTSAALDELLARYKMQENEPRVYVPTTDIANLFDILPAKLREIIGMYKVKRLTRNSKVFLGITPRMVTELRLGVSYEDLAAQYAGYTHDGQPVLESKAAQEPEPVAVQAVAEPVAYAAEEPEAEKEEPATSVSDQEPKVDYSQNPTMVTSARRRPEGLLSRIWSALTEANPADVDHAAIKEADRKRTAKAKLISTLKQEAAEQDAKLNRRRQMIDEELDDPKEIPAEPGLVEDKSAREQRPPMAYANHTPTASFEEHRRRMDNLGVRSVGFAVQGIRGDSYAKIGLEYLGKGLAASLAFVFGFVGGTALQIEFWGAEAKGLVYTQSKEPAADVQPIRKEDIGLKAVEVVRKSAEKSRKKQKQSRAKAAALVAKREDEEPVKVAVDGLAQPDYSGLDEVVDAVMPASVIEDVVVLQDGATNLIKKRTFRAHGEWKKLSDGTRVYEGAAHEELALGTQIYGGNLLISAWVRDNYNALLLPNVPEIIQKKAVIVLDYGNGRKVALPLSGRRLKKTDLVKRETRRFAREAEERARVCLDLIDPTDTGDYKLNTVASIAFPKQALASKVEKEKLKVAKAEIPAPEKTDKTKALDTGLENFLEAQLEAEADPLAPVTLGSTHQSIAEIVDLYNKGGYASAVGHAVFKDRYDRKNDDMLSAVLREAGRNGIEIGRFNRNLLTDEDKQIIYQLMLEGDGLKKERFEFVQDKLWGQYKMKVSYTSAMSVAKEFKEKLEKSRIKKECDEIKDQYGSFAGAHSDTFRDDLNPDLYA